MNFAIAENAASMVRALRRDSLRLAIRFVRHQVLLTRFLRVTRPRFLMHHTTMYRPNLDMVDRAKSGTDVMARSLQF